MFLKGGQVGSCSDKRIAVLGRFFVLHFYGNGALVNY